MRFLLYDIKRMFLPRKTLVLCILAPIVVMIIFSTVIAPLLFEFQETKKFSIAIFNEDETEFSKDFINYMLNSKSLENLVESFNVASVEQGKNLLASGSVIVFVYVPKDTYNNITESTPTKIHIYGTNEHIFEASIISISLGSALDWVGKGENILGIAEDFIIDKGVSEERADVFYNEMIDIGLDFMMDRRSLLDQEGVIAPLTEYLPIQYYLSAIFALFAGISILPLVRFTSLDLNSSVLHRSFAGSKGIINFISARILSGALFITLILSLIFPAGIATSAINDVLLANFVALTAGIAFSAIGLSSLAFLLASTFKKADSAMWISFWIVIILSIIGGCFVPYSYLPKAARIIGVFSPLRSCMRVILCGLFSFDKDIFFQEIIKLFALSSISVLLSYFLIKAKRWKI